MQKNNTKSRTYYSAYNAAASSIQRFVQIALAFTVRTLFIANIGGTYLGISGVMTNVLSVLSIGELGFGTAIISALYGPVARDERETVKSLMRLYSRVYRIICVVIVIMGLCLLPFLDILVKGENIPNLQIIYFLYLANSASSYLFAYKQSIINANQKNYYITISKLVLNVIQCGIQIFILVSLKNYLLYLIVEILCTIAQNIYISIKANNLFPYLKEKNIAPIHPDLKDRIKKNVGGTVLYRISGTILNGTDNILISSMIGVIWVGKYSNFTLVIKALQSFIDYAISAISGSVGNLTASESIEKQHEVYLKLFFFTAWIYGICTVGFWHLLIPFVKIWLGDYYVLTEFTMALVVLNFYIVGLQAPTAMYRTTMGLMWEGRFRPVVSAVLNLTVSILLARQIGMPGIFLGTLVSNLAILFWYDPLIIYKYGFKKSSKPYFVSYFKFVLATAISIGIMYFVKSIINSDTLYGFIICIIFSIATTCIVYTLFWFRSVEFKFYYKLVKNRIFKRKK